jgi:hypothetical protein
LERAVRSREIVEALPLGELFFEIDVIFVGEELIELFFISSMCTLDLSVELWGSRHDVGVADALVLDVPVEFGLELVPIVLTCPIFCTRRNERLLHE